MSQISSKSILIIQTAFIGDTILASHFAQEVKRVYPDHEIHFLLRKGNESVITGLPFIHRVWIWDKQGGKFRNLIKMISDLRQFHFSYVFNLHRHSSSGLVTQFVHADLKIGYRQNPLSLFFDHKVDHQIPHWHQGVPWHEVQRNMQLLKVVQPQLTITLRAQDYKPVLPLQTKNREKVAVYAQEKYVVVAPASVWFTKQWSEKKFRTLVEALSQELKVYLIGAPTDNDLCLRIAAGLSQVENLCGKLNLLDSAALMEKAQRVFVNDSAPLHLASAVNAPTTALFCSTIPAFGYTPLADEFKVMEVEEKLECRPCGLHGHRSCPKGHFDCSEKIDIKKVAATVLT